MGDQSNQQQQEAAVHGFAVEAAGVVARMWLERTGITLTESEVSHLVDGIWEVVAFKPLPGADAGSRDSADRSNEQGR